MTKELYYDEDIPSDAEARAELRRTRARKNGYAGDGHDHMVTVYCPSCNKGREVEMDIFWKRHVGRNRFVSQYCTCPYSRKHKTRISKWLRHPNNKEDSIGCWLAYHNAHDAQERPQHLTKEIFSIPHVAAAPSQSQARKREAADANEKCVPHKSQRT